MASGASLTDASFDAFVLLRRPALVQLGWALTGDRHRGEDLAQAALDRLWPRWERVSARGDAWPYLQRTAVSLAVTWQRRLWTTRELVVDELPERNGESGEADVLSAMQVRGWLASLPPRQRAAITLRFMLDWSVEDTAEALGCTPGTVKSQTSKALASLRKVAELEGSDGTEEARHGR